MKILGIDPGMAIVGYSIVDYDGKNIELEHSGSIQTPKGERESARLLEIFNDMTSIVEKYKPDVCAIEKLFFFRNQTTVMPVAHARGVILTVLEKFGIPIYEYTPMEVKQILTGYGRASKKEVEQMVKIALESEKLPKLDDTVDSIAIAISYTRSPDALEDLKKFEF
ncbi:TPA: crossover junction endodeoxyribonuclease RuvC [Candidatus Gastranaerophilales bacterium HUM_6]|jgi:crossover junction endodeoxyribonuclease RuvC|nr:crossover junction endodeoxyribonuclease RuvC [bacterium]MEE0496427.1 crossover junction endodeoxyribonuclease RuvC [Cyanobacteriota bacterium]CDE92044.1 crossover junction endodeoxyribonuclease RuvC [Fusobacterium sp. CAG:815]DAA89192.1 MAG TPA: crossover junction endodeoxyribonuclease RuvC [Candidatus Gastranaerophilales bacterium HUM_6]DAA92054.1 MAG TPA: crossover junction endodeoxyribonuclease RuvC [Candidatus Gastranaerophilales bacterium HUM_7]DAB02827.1 MAG TPA: crossover junction e